MASYSTPPGLDFVSHCYRGLTPTAIHVEPHSGFGVLVCEVGDVARLLRTALHLIISPAALARR